MDVHGKKILIIGDSHVDFSDFGKALEKYLTEAGAEVSREGVGGTSVVQWLQDTTCRPKKDRCVNLADLIGKNFDLVLVSLGTNDGANANVGGRPRADRFVTQMQELLRRAAPYGFHIGPPVQRGNHKHYTQAAVDPYADAAKAAFGNGFIDSRGVTAPWSPTSGDGIHYSKEGARAWARHVADEVLKRKPWSTGGEAAPATVPHKDKSKKRRVKPKKNSAWGWLVAAAALGGGFLWWRSTRRN